MDTIGRGIVAGFIAMLAVSLLVDPLVLITGTRWTQESGLGLRLHFFVGPAVWGAAFAFFHDHVRGPSWLRGVVFAAALWIAVSAVLAVSARPGPPGGGLGRGPRRGAGGARPLRRFPRRHLGCAGRPRGGARSSCPAIAPTGEVGRTAHSAGWVRKAKRAHHLFGAHAPA